MKHGRSLTGWFAAFAVQAALVCANRTDVAEVLSRHSGVLDDDHY